MSRVSYYSIIDEGVTGSLVIDSIIPDAAQKTDADLLELGYIRFEIPNGVLTVFPRYKDGVFTITPPPYWDELKLGIAKLPIAQRLLAQSVADVAVNGVFTMVSVAIAFNDYPSLKNSLGRVVDVLNYMQMPITSEEMDGLTELLLECGFTPDVWAEMVD